MANEAGIEYGTEITIEEAGAAVTDGSFSTIGDNNWTAANQEISTSLYYPSVRVRLTSLGFATNPDVGAVVNVYARPINFEGTEDQPPPSANYPHTYVGSMPVDDDQALTQAIERIFANPHPGTEQEWYIENQCGQTTDTNWNLRVTGVAIAPGA